MFPTIKKLLPPNQIAYLAPATPYLFADPNHPSAGLELLVMTAEGGGSWFRLRDGAKGTLSGDVWVTPVELA